MKLLTGKSQGANYKSKSQTKIRSFQPIIMLNKSSAKTSPKGQRNPIKEAKAG
jgi:hypothetical protein